MPRTSVRRVPFALLLAISALLFALASPVPAQAGSRDDMIIESFKRAANNFDDESFAFERLMQLVGNSGPRYEKLVSEYQKKVEKSPTKYRWRMLLGHTLRHGGRFDEAIASYQAAAKIKETPLVFLSTAKTQEAAKLFDEAISSYEAALSQSRSKNTKIEILQALGRIALDRRQLDVAMGYFQQLVEVSPRDIFIRRELVQLLLENKRYEEALSQLQSAIKMTRNRRSKVQLLLKVGDVYTAWSKDEEAVKAYRFAAKSAPGDAWVKNESEQRIINIYRKNNDLAGLLDYYKESWKRPSFSQLMILGKLSEEVGLLEQALDYIQRAIKSSPRNLDAHLRRLQILRQTGRTAEIQKAYLTLIKTDPREPRHRFELAELLDQAQQRKAALKVLSDASRAFPRDTEVQSQVADKYENWGLPKLALATYERLVKIDPDEPAHLENLGEFHYSAGKEKEAIVIWKRVLKAIPERPDAHAYLAKIYSDHNMLEAAVEEMKTAIKLAPKEIDFLSDLAEIYESNQRWTQALVTWEEIDSKTDNPYRRDEVRTHIINILDRTGGLRARLRELKARFEATPPDLDAGRFLAQAHFKLKDLDATAQILKKLLEADPADVPALRQLNRVYVAQNANKKAIEVLKTLVERDPQNAASYHPQIIDIYLKMGDSEQAQAWMPKLLEAASQDPAAHSKLGEVYLRRLDYPRAAAAYEQAIRLDPRAHENYFDLAEVYTRLNRNAEADHLYRQVVRTSRNENLIIKAARRSIDHNEFSGTLSELEVEFAPLLNVLPKRQAYRNILLDLYFTMTRQHVARARSGDPKTRQRARAALVEIGARATRPLIDAITSGDPGGKGEAISLLGEMGNSSAAGILAKFLNQSESRIHTRAALSLGKLANPASIISLSTAASSSRGLRVKELSTWALGRIGTSESARALVAIADGFSTSSSTRALAAIGLGRHQAGDLGMLQELAKERIPIVQHAAIWAIGEQGDPRALPELLTLLERSDDPRTRAMVLWALSAFSDKDAASVLITAYWSGHGEIREGAALGLRRMAARVAEEKGKTQKKDGEEGPGVYSLWEENLSFIDVHDEDALFDVRGLLDELVRASQLSGGAHDGHLNAFMEAHHAQLLSLATEILKGTDYEARSQLLSDLDSHPDRVSIGPLGETLLSLDDEANAKVQALVKKLTPELIALLSAEQPQARQHAASLLGKLGSKEAAGDLIAALSDPSVEVQRQAALALGRIGDPSAFDPLIKTLSSEHFAVRSYAAWGLGLLKDPRAFDPLIKVLDDPFIFSRSFAARGLAVLGDPRAVEALNKQIESAPPSLQIELILALDALGSPSRSKAVLDSSEAAVREAARDAIAE